MKKLLFLILGLALLSNIFFYTLSLPVLAESTKTFQQGLDNSANAIGYPAVNQNNNITASLYSRIGSVLKLVISFLGIIFLGLIIYAGIIWLMARGNEQEVTKAREIIYGAAIGLAIVLSAYALTQLAATLWK
ncbi:MAG: hypothetical protein Q7R92_03775 [bacterium]|nr:hypothetical protein [bacterium]